MSSANNCERFGSSGAGQVGNLHILQEMPFFPSLVYTIEEVSHQRTAVINKGRTWLMALEWKGLSLRILLYHIDWIAMIDPASSLLKRWNEIAKSISPERKGGVNGSSVHGP